MTKRAKEKANIELRERAQNAGVTLWEIADKLGVCEITVIRWLRHELDENKKAEIINIIDELAKEAE